MHHTCTSSVLQVGPAPTNHSSGPLNSFNYWKNPPSHLQNQLPKKVSQQEFLDTAAANAAKTAGVGPLERIRKNAERKAKAGGGASETSLDMSKWPGNRTGAGLLSRLSAVRVRSSSWRALPATRTACARALCLNVNVWLEGQRLAMHASSNDLLMLLPHLMWCAV